MAEITWRRSWVRVGFEKQLVSSRSTPSSRASATSSTCSSPRPRPSSTLTHGNIVPVTSWGVIDDTYFIAMEYIDGRPCYG